MIPSRASDTLNRDLQLLFGPGTFAGLTDRELMERIERADRSDPALLERYYDVLVSRHGPMVFQVCRRTLADPNDAADAFQATFLVLIRRRTAIRRLDSLASWLYGVAGRVSARARVDAGRRRRVEQQRHALTGSTGLNGATEVAVADANQADDPAAAEQVRIVQQEVARLPEHYRDPIVLCYWEGLTQEQAAERLACPLGTVRSRLARGRDLLKRRLVRRGVVAGAAAAALDRLASTTLAAVLAPPLALVRSTARAMALLASGKKAAGIVSASVLGLVRFMVWRMSMVPIKVAVTTLAMGGLVAMASGQGVLLSSAPPATEQEFQKRADPEAGEKNVKPPPSSSERRAAPSSDVVKVDSRTDRPSRPRSIVAKNAKRPPELKAMPEYIVEPPDLLRVEVLEALPGRPISGEHLVRPDGSINLGFYGEVKVAGLTLAEIKEKIVRHLRKYLSDDALGLHQFNEEGEHLSEIAPKDSNRVSIDVVAYNSKVYYVQGAVAAPGRLPITGHETILDAINLTGGLLADADLDMMMLHRTPTGDGPVKTLIVDLEEIMMGADLSTNYQLQPGDRLVVMKRKPAGIFGSVTAPQVEPQVAAELRAERETRQAEGRDAQVSQTSEQPVGTLQQHDPSTDLPVIPRLESRITEIEHKLDQILEKLERIGN